ncbi:MAG: hypothetical protein H0V34_04245 [Gammaproteobacteria bacterium]|nr:hypothetical protein [Gammaproteobacteria bacterium]MBA3731331.1 hypothetical protein [Gammaproteobacteria bacterium]
MLSSGWLEYFASGPNADFLRNRHKADGGTSCPDCKPLRNFFKRILQQRGEGDALQAVALMQQGIVVVPTASLALTTARLSCGELALALVWLIIGQPKIAGEEFILLVTGMIDMTVGLDDTL